MNPAPHNFETLRRLLALKRHEQPPPGYFENFSGSVIARLQAGERAGESLLERWFGQSLLQFRSLFEVKPALAGTFGAALCGMLIWAVVSSEKPDAAAINLADPSGAFAAIPTAQNASLEASIPHGLTISNGFVTAGPRESLFNDLRAHGRPFIQPVSLSGN